MPALRKQWKQLVGLNPGIVLVSIPGRVKGFPHAQ